jgi:parallel beta-helix repeat protein
MAPVLLVHGQSGQTVPLTPGMLINRSVTITPGHYLIPADSTGAIIIRGDGIEVDFGGAVLDGAPQGTPPDAFSGTGIRVEGGQDIIIRNAVVRGYKLGLWATNTPGIRITESDFSYNWRQRLKSTIEREHLDDWMSYHNNENDEWMRYGAAMYLRRADRAQVDNVKVTGGQNALMLTDVNDGLFYNNTFTFNSSIGIGMYRSSRNRVQHNRLDWSVRGYSHGVYNRGQDSAAILLYEQSNENVFAYNSATHSGDGLFLWAGQTTMDTGMGGCNDNIIYGNDFSFAPTNGIEVTFSRNHIERNRMEGCWHGIWGGYSYDTAILDNVFVDNDEHIAIEHGQDIRIEGNAFTGGELGLYAWERPTQPADWGYAEYRDVRSRDYTVVDNTFEGVSKPFQVRQTSGVLLADNHLKDFSELEMTGVDGTWDAEQDAGGKGGIQAGDPTRMPPPAVIPGAMDVTRSAAHPWSRAYILVDEWGPVDFRSPVLWPRSPRKDRVQGFELVGPPGRVSLISATGVDSVALHGGSVPGRATVWLADTDVVDLDIQLAFEGAEVVDRFGNVTPAGTPYRFGYRYFFVPITWDVAWFNYSEATDPREQPDAFQELIEGKPSATSTVEDLGFQWYRAPAAGVGQDHFATVATGRFSVPAERYVMDLTSDDGVRVWLDGRLVHDDWTYHAPRLEQIPLDLGGDHEIRIEHFEITGYSTLVVSLQRQVGRER